MVVCRYISWSKSANGIAVIPNIYYGTYWTIVNPGAVALYPMTLFDNTSPEGPFMFPPMSDFFDATNITSIEEIKMTIEIAPYFNGTGIGEVLLDKTFILNP